MVRPVHNTRVLQYIFLFLFIQSTRHLRPSKINTHTNTQQHMRTKRKMKRRQVSKLKNYAHNTHAGGKDTKTNSKITSTNM